MAVTRADVEKLKRDWKSDPCWDIYDTEGFEEYRNELIDFQLLCEQEWKEEREEKELKLIRETEKLGIVGLYKIILKQQEQIERQNKAIELLADGDNLTAWKVLIGMEQ